MSQQALFTFNELEKEVMRETAQGELKSLAERRRDKGMAKGIAHANADQGNWKLPAIQAIPHFLAIQGDRPFLAEQFIEWSKLRLYPQPPDPRAWGGIFIEAAKQGLIEKSGEHSTKTTNACPKPLWRRSQPNGKAND